jgi:hypothetical protein
MPKSCAALWAGHLETATGKIENHNAPSGFSNASKRSAVPRAAEFASHQSEFFKKSRNVIPDILGIRKLHETPFDSDLWFTGFAIVRSGHSEHL